MSSKLSLLLKAQHFSRILTLSHRHSKLELISTLPFQKSLRRDFSSINTMSEAPGRNTSNKGSEAAFVVQHNLTDSQFYIEMKGSTERAVLDYEMRNNVADLYHTEVPPVFRGKGIAKIIVQHALSHFSEKGYTIRPTCWFVDAYLMEHGDVDVKVTSD